VQAESAGALFALLAVAIQTWFAPDWDGFSLHYLGGVSYLAALACAWVWLWKDTDKDKDKIMDMATPAQRAHGVPSFIQRRLQLRNCCIARSNGLTALALAYPA
jgi:hypothetical protein